MEVFSLTLQQMMTMFILMAVGFILRKKNLLPGNAGTAIAKLLTYVVAPALALKAQINNCSIETLTKNIEFPLFGLALTLAAIAVAYPLSKLFIRNHRESPELTYQRNIYKYALAFANYGYVGDFLIIGIFGGIDSIEYFQYSLFKFFMNIICYSWGLYVLIPKDKGDSVLKNLKKGLLTPPMIAVVLGIVLGLLNVREYVPEGIMTPIMNVLDSAGKCQGLSMVLAGFVVGGYSFKEMILNKKVYFASLMRLLIIPSIMLSIFTLINIPAVQSAINFSISDQVILFTLFAFAAPLGLNTIVYPATYGGDTKTGASMTLISSMLSVITLPLMYLLFVVIL